MKRNKFVKIGISLFLATMMLSGCGTKPTETVVLENGNTQGNICNLGAVADTADYSYYQKGEKLNIYKSKDGKDETKLCDNGAYFINVMGDYVYYANSDDGFKIYRMKTDGTENTKIIDAQAYYMTVTKDSIYYVDYNNDHAIFKASLDGKDNKKIYSGSAFYLNVYDGNLYFTDEKLNYSIVETDLDGQNPKVIVEKYACFLNISNGYAYYTIPHNQSNPMGDDCLYRTEISTRETEKIIDTPCGDINVHNSKIYYNDWKQNKLCSFNEDTNETKVESNEPGAFINIGANKIFYAFNNNGTPELRTKDIK